MKYIIEKMNNKNECICCKNGKRFKEHNYLWYCKKHWEIIKWDLNNYPYKLQETVKEFRGKMKRLDSMPETWGGE